jgi:membrane protein implicated in regulation of membrane protease activity
MSRELLQWFILIVFILMLVVLVALLIIAILDSRNEQPAQKKRKRKKGRRDSEELPTWIYVAGAVFFLAIAVAVLAGLYFLIRVALEWVGNAAAAVGMWLEAISLKATALWNSQGFGWFLWLLLIVGFLAWLGERLSLSSSSESSRSWGDDSRSQKEIEEDERRQKKFWWGHEDGVSGVVSDFVGGFNPLSSIADAREAREERNEQVREQLDYEDYERERQERYER